MQNSGNRERGSLPGVRSALTSFLRSPPNDLFDSLSLAVFAWFGHCDPSRKLGSTEEAPRLYVFVSGIFSGLPAITSFSWEAPVNPMAGASSYLNQRVGLPFQCHLITYLLFAHLLESIRSRQRGGAGGGYDRNAWKSGRMPLHALECVRLAQTSATRQGRDHFAKLARTWIKLAEDLDRSRKFLDKIAAESETQAG